jgi:hypothetical protein
MTRDWGIISYLKKLEERIVNMEGGIKAHLLFSPSFPIPPSLFKISPGA